MVEISTNIGSKDGSDIVIGDMSEDDFMSLFFKPVEVERMKAEEWQQDLMENMRVAVEEAAKKKAPEV